MSSVAVLGSTGSIGTQTLEIVRCGGGYEVSALAAGRRADDLIAQAREFGPELVVAGDAPTAAVVRDALPATIEVAHGPEALAEAAGRADVVVNAVVGFAGLPVTLAALGAGRRLALANKESLIAAGPVVRSALATPGAELLPVDSEHCALHQCLRSNTRPGSGTAAATGGTATLADVAMAEVARLVLTASGGPFRGRSRAELETVTVAEALAHPTWSMGPKITVDSSTLMNKGLEVIEAQVLYGLDFDRIEVVVHPQSIVHSMVEFCDGATIAQLSEPDMRLCIGYALAYPERLDQTHGRIDWTSVARLDFEPPDLEAFECLGLAYQAGRAGETAPACLNAANEVAVQAFLDGEIPWAAIARVCDEVLQGHDGTRATSADVVIDVDRQARERARRVIAAHRSAP